MSMNVLVIGQSDIGQAIIEGFPEGTMVGKEICDVRDIQGLKELFIAHNPNVIVNCAGVSHIQSIVDSSPEKWEEEMSVNLFGSYAVAKAAAEVKPDATLIFFASVAGLFGKAEHSGYSASKAGVRSLVQSLSMEGFEAYSISPGRVDTKMREKDFPGEDSRTRLTTEQVAKVVRQCVDGNYESGDNLIIRKRGFRTLRRRDSGQPWKEYLAVQPIGAPKTI